MRPYFCLLLLTLSLNLSAQNADTFFPEEFVVTANALNLREAPDANSAKVATLPQGTVVSFVSSYNNGQFTMLDTTDENSPYGRWIKVNYKNKSGWIFDAYVSSTIALYYEDSPQFTMSAVPPLYWYGVYARDSFADELRKVQVRLADEPNEFYGGTVKMLRTNQSESSKFLIASNTPLSTGYCGPLGMFNTNDVFYARSLGPGSQISIYPGNEINDTLFKPNYGLAAIGCAAFDNNYVRISNYQLMLFNYFSDPIQTQDLTPWVRTDAPEINPAVDLLWFGDLDRDNKPDAIIQDCPFEVGCRASLFLSSKAKPGAFLQKVCEFYWPGD